MDPLHGAGAMLSGTEPASPVVLLYEEQVRPSRVEGCPSVEPPGLLLLAALLGADPNAPTADPARYVVLQDAAAQFGIARATGALGGGWDRATGQRVLVAANDRYTVDTETDTAHSSELLDRVVQLQETTVEGRPAVVLTCENRALPGLTIEKRYVLQPDRSLTKRVAFTTTDAAGFFITYAAETRLDPAFLARSSRSADLPSLPAGAAAALGDSATGDEPLAIATDYSLGVAAFRTHVNDRFVLRTKAQGTADGWLNRVFTDYLRAGEQVSGEACWALFTGDFATFEQFYQALPEYQALWDFRRPAWPQQVVADAMYLGPRTSYAFNRACNPDLVTVTIWFLNPPWGNWQPDSDPPKSRSKDVYGIAPNWRTMFPNTRVSAYTNCLFDSQSDVYRDHPEFGVRGLDGQLITGGLVSDTQGRPPTFTFQINNPACREYLLQMHTARFQQWGLDYHYMDGPGFGAELPDWQLRDVAQGYDWSDYLRTLRERLQAVNPEAAIFVNGPRRPYSDLAYWEWRDTQWLALAGADWRPLALDLLRVKLTEGPGQVIVPTFGHATADPAEAVYTALYGWCGNFYEPGRVPWMREARRYRGMRLVPEAVEPRWWRSDVGFEAYGFRLGEQAVVQVLSHEAEARDITVQVDTAKLGLQPGEPVVATLSLLNDPSSDLQPDPAGGKPTRVWRNTEAAVRSELFAPRPCPPTLELTVPARPMLLSTVVLARQGGAQQ